MFKLKLLYHFLLFTLYQVNCDDNFPRLWIPQGNVQGIYLKTPKGKLYEAYLGIPYAKPPVGELRFKIAEPAAPWIGTYNASTYGNDCLQIPFFNGSSVTGSENCLFINVYKPHRKSKDDGSLFEVMADIHGGGFSGGSSSWTRPAKFMDFDVVFASFNYRLGPIGFMSTGDKFLPGNLGLKDQTLALKWIKENIKYFGGDKNKVTLTGVSAGGASVHYHYVSPLSNGLFHRGISSSGVTLNPWSFAEDVPKKTKIVANMMGCPTDKSDVMVDCLRTRPAEQIFNHLHLFRGFQFLPFAPFGPVVEPEDAVSPFITRHPYDIIKDGQTASVPWLCSFATHEGIFPYVEDAKLLNDLQNNWDELLPHLLDFNYTVSSIEQRKLVSNIIKTNYLKNKPVTESVDELIQMAGDRLFSAGIIQSALMQATASKAPIYLYRFGYNMECQDCKNFFKLEKNYGTAHGEETFYLYNLNELIWLPTGKLTQNDLLISEKMLNLWIKFVKTGIPTIGDLNLRSVQEGLPKIKYLEISNESPTVETKEDMHQLHFWSTVPLNENLKLPNQLRDEL